MTIALLVLLAAAAPARAAAPPAPLVHFGVARGGHVFLHAASPGLGPDTLPPSARGPLLELPGAPGDDGPDDYVIVSSGRIVRHAMPGDGDEDDCGC